MPSESACRPIVQSPKRLPKPAWNLYVSIPSDSAPWILDCLRNMLSLFLAGSAASAPPENEQILDRITASQGIIYIILDQFTRKQTYGNAAVHVPIMSLRHKWCKDFSEKIPSHMSKPPEIDPLSLPPWWPSLQPDERHHTQCFHSCLML